MSWSLSLSCENIGEIRIRVAASRWGSIGCQPVLFGSLAEKRFAILRNERDDVVGKLPPTAGWQPALPRLSLRVYFFGVGVGVGDVDVAAAVSSIPKVQCVSIFLPPDFALRITVHVFSRNFCVT